MMPRNRRRYVGLALVCAFAWSASAASSETLQYNMSCGPTTVSTKPLGIVLPPRHGPELMVVDPKGVYWFVAFPHPPSNKLAKPPIDGSAFGRARTISLDVEKTLGITWIGRTTPPSRVFSWTGTYRVFVGSSLDSEAPTIDGWCTVRVTLL